MLTYVINTSENKTFDSTMLFELAGYNKIRWLNCALQDVRKCAEEIFEKQNVLVADNFRIAIIVDFFGFDRIRAPYGRKGTYGIDEGVDVSIYMPYIEAYLLDNLIFYLENNNLFATDFEVYYVQNEKTERYELFDNAKNQLCKVLEGETKAEVNQDVTEDEIKSYCEERFGDRERDGVKICSEDNVVVKITQLTSLPIKEEKAPVTKSKVKSKAKSTDVDPANDTEVTEENAENADALLRAELLHDENDKGKLYPFILKSGIRVGDEVRVADQSTPDEYQTFTVNELYRADGKPLTSSNKAKTEVFIRIPKEITVGNESVISKCETVYSSFKLYCTPAVSLSFKLSDYPYGLNAMTFSDFWIAFRERMAIKTDIRRHYYLTSYGGGASRAALDTLSLSLYLIRMYEREESIKTEGTLEIAHIDSGILKDVLETAWSKINTAKAVAKKNNLNYYSLEQDTAETVFVEEEKIKPKDAIARERAKLPAEIKNTKKSADILYNNIIQMCDRNSGEVQNQNRKEFDKIMGGYLRQRDQTREADIEEEFQNLKAAGFLKMTDQCPSKEEYDYAIDIKEKEISKTFERALKAEYLEVSYDKEKEKAEKAYTDHNHARACLHRNIIGDIIFMIIVVIAMVVPYYTLQLSYFTADGISAAVLGAYSALFFAGMFMLAVILQVLPQLRKLKKTKQQLKNYYLDCCAKNNYLFSAIRRRYEKYLIDIEQSRYDIRQLKRIYNANLEKDKNVTTHHDMLDKLVDCLSGILNNLDVEPKIDLVDSVEEEFDLSRPVCSRENKVYQIFSIETIETMFPKKGVE